MVPPGIQPIACRKGACGSGPWPARHPEGARAFKGYRGATPETYLLPRTDSMQLWRLLHTRESAMKR
jgi:hypothetical protein